MKNTKSILLAEYEFLMMRWEATRHPDDAQRIVEILHSPNIGIKVTERNDGKILIVRNKYSGNKCATCQEIILKAEYCIVQNKVAYHPSLPCAGSERFNHPYIQATLRNKELEIIPISQLDKSN